MTASPAAATGSDSAQGGVLRALRPFAFLGIAAEVALVVYLVGAYDVESRTFQHLMWAVLGGFVVHHCLPLRWRLPFFGALSLGLTAWALGIQEGHFQPAVGATRVALLIGIGAALIGVARLPLRFAMRVAILLAIGAGLAWARIALTEAPALSAIWPVLGAMFMFRLAVYLYDTEHDKKPPGLAQTVAYFFMLPNVCFTLFPVVDYKTFSRAHYPADPLRIYQRGAQWMARGLLQILLWRVVYYHVHLDPSRVRDGADLVQYIVSNVLLYLRVSGSFHLIVGVLHLFGFALPPTNRRYFLAASFNDYWRRVNIYWKDFIMKMIYYPITFRLKTWGTASKVTLATAIAFGISWLLHSYQLFWLRGTFPIQLREAIFWGSLGLLVIANSLWEMRPGRRTKKGPLDLRDRLGLALRTMGTFTVITLLWSLWNCESVAQWVSLWHYADWSTLGWSAVVLAIVGGLAIPFGGDAGAPAPLTSKPRRGVTAPSARAAFWQSAFVQAPIVALLAFAGVRPFLAPHLPEAAQVVIKSLAWTRPNDADGEREVLGYYDNAIEASNFNRALGGEAGGPPAGWQRQIEDTSAARRTGAFPLTELVPSRSTVINGKTITTNSFGLRDREYTLDKPPNTVRIALIGSSGEMGWGVDDGETYETITEERLNRELSPQTGQHYEILNFSMNGWSAIEQPTVLRERVARFRPDVVVYGAHSGDRFFVMTRLGDAYRQGVTPPESALAQLASDVGLDAATTSPQVLRKLTPRADELLAFGYRRMVEEAKQIDARPIWLWVPLPKGGQVDVTESAKMQAMASEAGFATLSLADAYRGGDPELLVVAPWDGHPSAAGHRMLGDDWFEKLTSPESRALLAPAATQQASGSSAGQEERNRGNDD